jgi:ribosomal protein S18 acetylase RimI-like enzyme
MGINSSISRLTEYFTRHGFAATFRRAASEVQRALSASGMIVFYCDLAKQNAIPTNLPDSLRVERVCSHAELSAEDLQAMTSFWNPRQARRNIEERFAKGASLWLVWSGGRLAGYSWTLRGSTIAPYYFPMAEDDVQLFDFYVFPKFRGRAILWFLIMVVLRALKEEGASRVFGDVAEWNQPSLAFYRTVPFQRLGRVKQSTIFGRTYFSWASNEELNARKDEKFENVSASVNARKQSSVTHPRV